jgi:diguanylate cyclase (GGDEF)-like protein/PAS domain S-box-containing protein
MPTPSDATPATTLSESAVRELVAGRRVGRHDSAGVALPFPEWLPPNAPVDGPVWSGVIGDVHPNDRMTLGVAWLSVLERPLEPAGCILRGRVDDQLHEFDCLIVAVDGAEGPDLLVAFKDLGRRPDPGDWDLLEADLALQATPIVVQYLDRTGSLILVDGQVEEMFGRSAEEMVGTVAVDMVHERHHGALLELWARLLADPTAIQSMQLEMLHPDGTTRWIESTTINRLADERIGAFVVLSRDITEQLAAEEAALERAAELRRSHEEFEILANHVPAAVFRIDSDGGITFANQQWHALADVGPSTGGAPLSLFDPVAEDDRRALAGTLRRLADATGPSSAAIEVRSADGIRVFSLACQVVGEAGGGHARPIIGSMTDVTSTTQLRHLARHDELTGLLNRRSIDARLAEALADNPEEVVVMFVDLDGFKAVNDDFGHEAGDEVLRAVATRLREAVRPSDDVARYGGDEFVIVCRQAAAGAEPLVAARIQDALSSPIEFHGGRWHPAASLGSARAEPGESLTSMLGRADRAMYETKRARHAAALERTGYSSSS